MLKQGLASNSSDEFMAASGGFRLLEGPRLQEFAFKGLGSVD